VEFYYQDQLRWSLGFENPNKAAALLASLLPLLWIPYALTWRLKPPGARRMALFASGIALLAGWFLLIKTYSRGGIVAAFAGFVYIGWQNRRLLCLKAARLWTTAAIGVIIASVFLTTGAAQRTTGWIASREGSVDNRFELWKGALRMIAAVPQGVGAGNSGEIYMQWFQPLESRARYRTLVNSYLTFGIEQGLLLFCLCACGGLWIWFALKLRDTDSARAEWVDGMRGGLLGFAIAGTFSTTMEERILWMVPITSVIVLLVLTRGAFSSSHCKKAAGTAACLSSGIGGLLLASGWLLTQHEPLRVGISHSSGSAVVSIRSDRVVHDRTTTVIPDEAVVGRDYGKLFRQLAIKTRLALKVTASADPGDVDLIACGTAVHAISPNHRFERLILISPDRLADSEAERICRTASRAAVYLGNFDEDGRAAVWNRATKALPNVSLHEIDGVGMNVEWAWDAILPLIRADLAPST
jgi:hypothetical protein